jgi:hypothetical protein
VLNGGVFGCALDEEQYGRGVEIISLARNYFTKKGFSWRL